MTPSTEGVCLLAGAAVAAAVGRGVWRHSGVRRWIVAALTGVAVLLFCLGLERLTRAGADVRRWPEPQNAVSTLAVVVALAAVWKRGGAGRWAWTAGERTADRSRARALTTAGPAALIGCLLMLWCGAPQWTALAFVVAGTAAHWRAISLAARSGAPLGELASPTA